MAAPACIQAPAEAEAVDTLKRRKSRLTRMKNTLSLLALAAQAMSTADQQVHLIYPLMEDQRAVMACIARRIIQQKAMAETEVLAAEAAEQDLLILSITVSLAERVALTVHREHPRLVIIDSLVAQAREQPLVHLETPTENYMQVAEAEVVDITITKGSPTED